MTSVTPSWTITDHVCGSCFGRLLRSVHSEAAGPTSYRCAICGVEGTATGLDENSICACALQMAGRDLGLRCRPNFNRSSERPWEIVARELDVDADSPPPAAADARANGPTA